MKYIALFLLIACTACKHDAIESTRTGNDIKLELLFEKNGCKVYRFLDGYYVYWTDCSGRLDATHVHHTGKNSTRTVHVASIID